MSKVEEMTNQLEWNDPELDNYSYFQEIIRQVDLIREFLKMHIDDYSDEIIQSIKSTRDRLTQENKNIVTENEEYSFLFSEINTANIFGRFDVNSVREIYIFDLINSN
jgi:hypothetical protein